ncbi:MAG: ABC transporter ATP-binding protein [Hyphomicrobium sp.]|nr:ABC transporter ATP-binding protein [Hyphomicrobium sp.]
MQSRAVAIRLAGINKSYRIYSNPLLRVADALFPNSNVQRFKAVHALKDIDLEVYRGETVGIVGSNGAGKSTLLQVVCRTLKPDSGTLEVNGRISALLELGTSFNPEFTGRENVRINALVLGLTLAELERKFPDIVAFADIGDFIDRPVKTYSSGMFARLAFAVAIHVDPEILIIDEALAVGDEAFRRKCYARLERIKHSGATILFVSHSANTIIELCDRAILMYRGEKLMTGTPRDIITYYQKLVYSDPAEHRAIVANIRAGGDPVNSDAKSTTGANERGDPSPPADGPRAAAGQTIPSAGRDTAPVPSVSDADYFDPSLKSKSFESYPTRGAEISNVRILDATGKKVNALTTGRDYVYTYDVRFTQDCQNVRCSMLLKTVTGVELGAQWTTPFGMGIPEVKAGTNLRVSFPFRLPLNPGNYFGNAGVQGFIDDEMCIMHRLIDAIMFKIRPTKRGRADRYVDILSGEPEVVEIS